MMRSRNAQTFAILVFVAVLSPATYEWLPQWLETFRTTYWLGLAVAAGALVLLGGLATACVKLCPLTADAATMMQMAIGPWVGRTVTLLWALVLCLYGAKLLFSAIELLHYMVLPRTPSIVLIAFALLIPFQLFQGGLPAVLRYQTTLFWPTLLFAVLMLLVCIRQLDWHQLLPLWAFPHGMPWKDLWVSTELLPGWLVTVLYMLAFRQQEVVPRALFKSYVLGVAGVFMLHLLNLIIVTGNFGAFEGATLRWSVVETLRMQLPIRLDILFLLPMLVGISGTLNLCVFGAYTLVAPYIPTRRWQVRLYVVLLLLCGGLAVVPDYDREVADWYGQAAITMVLLLALILSGWWVSHIVKPRRNANGP